MNMSHTTGVLQIWTHLPLPLGGSSLEDEEQDVPSCLSKLQRRSLVKRMGNCLGPSSEYPLGSDWGDLGGAKNWGEGLEHVQDGMLFTINLPPTHLHRVILFHVPKWAGEVLSKETSQFSPDSACYYPRLVSASLEWGVQGTDSLKRA